eukprot:4894703-Pyramimonas_sp.AAC.1
MEGGRRRGRGGRRLGGSRRRSAQCWRLAMLGSRGSSALLGPCLHRGGRQQGGAGAGRRRPETCS